MPCTQTKSFLVAAAVSFFGFLVFLFFFIFVMFYLHLTFVCIWLFIRLVSFDTQLTRLLSQSSAIMCLAIFVEVSLNFSCCPHVVWGADGSSLFLL